MQTVYLLYIAEIVYRQRIIEQAETTIYCQQIFRLSSTDWHRFLGFRLADSGIDIHANIYKRKQILWEEKADKKQIMQRYRLNTIDIIQILRQIISKKIIQLCEIQAAVLQTIQDNKNPVIAVIQTDKEKNILFILPVFAESSGTTIVIVLLILLRRDIIQQCQILGILYIL